MKIYSLLSFWTVFTSHNEEGAYDAAAAWGHPHTETHLPPVAWGVMSKGEQESTDRETEREAGEKEAKSKQGI